MTDFKEARQMMVDCQVRPSDVTKYPIIEAMLDVPREQFVPRAQRDTAYAETEIPVAPGRTLLAPRSFAKMLEAAAIQPGDLVLELAPATGYSTAVLARLAAMVIAVEPDESLAATASDTLNSLEIDNAVVTAADPRQGDATHGPYDVIFVNAAVEEIPSELVDQLKDGGRLVAIVMDGPIGQCKVAVKSGGTVSARPAFDATATVLEVFRKQEEFAF